MPISKEHTGYLALDEMVSAVSYNNCLVILKQKTDEFLFLNDSQSDFMRNIWDKDASTFTTEEKLAVEEMRSIGIVGPQLSPRERPLLEDEKVSIGLTDTRWSQSDVKVDIRSFRPHYFFKAMYLISSIRKVPEKYRLQRIIDSLRSKREQQKVDNPRELFLIAENVNFAIRLSIKKVQCLEFAYAACSIAMQCGIFCTFRIGIQTHPFMSHAWIESKAGVVMDRSDLPSELAIIVSVSGTSND